MEAKYDKLKSRFITVVVIAVGLAIALITTIAGLIGTSDQAGKYKAILEVACQRTDDYTTCKYGLEQLKTMEIEDIKKFGGRR